MGVSTPFIYFNDVKLAKWQRLIFLLQIIKFTKEANNKKMLKINICWIK